MFTLTSAKLTGNPNPSGWTQVHEFIYEDEEKTKNRGHLFAVISTKDASVGREILTRFHEEYFGGEETSAFTALKGATQKVISEFFQEEKGVEIAAVSVVENTVYSAAGGGGQILLFRGGTTSRILGSKGGEVITASGYPKDSDLLIACTGGFLLELSNQKINSALTSGNPSLAVETLAPEVLNKETSGNLGAVIVKFTYQSEVAEDVTLGKKIGFGHLFTPITDFLIKSTNGLTKFFPKREIYIKREVVEVEGVEFSQKRKIAVSVGVILLILLLVSIVFGIRQRGVSLSRARYDGRLIQAEKDFSESQGLVSLNPERARELFLASLGTVNLLISEKVSDPRLSTLKKNLEDNEGTILGEYRTTPDLFLDLTLLSSGFNGDGLSTSPDKLFVLDKKGNKVVGITISSKKSEIVAGPDQIQSATSLASYGDRVFVLTSSGVYEVGNTKNKVLEADWSGTPFIYAFSGNIYILDNKSIWRYQGASLGSGFGAKQDWLATGSNVDFTNAKKWTIDGSIYVITDSGRILKFSQGSPQNFAPTGIAPKLSNVDAIYASDETKFIYYLDRAGKRVVVTDKDGKFKAQYSSPQIGEAKDLAVSESDKKIILLTGSKLFSIEIKHL